MTRIEELQQAIIALPEEDYCQFRQWFLERDWEKWDREIEVDVQGGALDSLVEEASEAKINKKP